MVHNRHFFSYCSTNSKDLESFTTKGEAMTEIRYTTVETAKLIRAELKATFPTIKFSVRKEHYGVLNISFDGNKEIKNQVDEIAAKYECGSFDGMTDSHSYSSKRVGDLLIDYSTRFIFVNCHYTEKAVA